MSSPTETKPAMEGWKATHRINGREVMRVIERRRIGGTGKEQDFAVYYLPDGKRTMTNRGTVAVPIPREEDFVKPLTPYEQGFRDGYAKALEQLGRNQGEIDRALAEFAIPEQPAEFKRFRTHQIAAGFYSIQSTQGGNPWIIDASNGEGKYLGRDERGNHLVDVAIFDFKTKQHFNWRVRIPEEIYLEVVPKETGNGE